MIIHDSDTGVSLEGRFFSQDASHLAERFSSLIEGDLQIIVLDFSKVEFFSATCMRALLEMNSALPTGRRVQLKAVPPTLMESFQLVGLDQLFEFVA